MRHAMTRVLLLVGALMALAYPAHAQPVQGLAVAACGTPGITITAGTPGPFTVDTTGKLCDSSSGGGGGGLSVVDQTAWTQGTSPFTPTGCVFNDTATLASGQEGTVRCTPDRQFKVSETPGNTLITLSGWTTATTGNATQALFSAGGWPAVLLQLDQTSTISAGAVTIEGTYDGTNWVAIPVAQVLNPNTLQPLTNPYTLVASTNQPFLILTQGYQAVRIRLSTTITGTGTVTPFVTLLPTQPITGPLLNPLAAGSAIVGKLGIDQTTPGTTNNVTVSPLPRAVRNTLGCTVGTSSAQCLAAATAVNFLQLQNVNATSTNNIACNIVGGTAVLNSATSIQLAPGQSASWGPNTAGVPSGAINCIGTSASSPLYVEWN